MATTTESVLSSRAVARWIRVSPRKMRLVADMVRGRPVAEAVDLLLYTTKRAARPVRKAIMSAFANLRQTDEGAKLEPEQVFVHQIRVDEGPMFKRWNPRALGRAYIVRHRLSHLTVILSTQIPSQIKEKELKRLKKRLATFAKPARSKSTRVIKQKEMKPSSESSSPQQTSHQG